MRPDCCQLVAYHPRPNCPHDLHRPRAGRVEIRSTPPTQPSLGLRDRVVVAPSQHQRERGCSQGRWTVAARHGVALAAPGLDAPESFLGFGASGGGRRDQGQLDGPEREIEMRVISHDLAVVTAAPRPPILAGCVVARAMLRTCWPAPRLTPDPAGRLAPFQRGTALRTG